MRGEFEKVMKKSKKNKKRKEGQNTLAKYLLARIALATIMGIIVYVIIYLFFSVKGVIPPGDGLNKTDWLSFLGAYLSFYGTVVVSLTIFWHTNYVAKQSEEKIALERKKRIQPVFSINIRSRNIVMEKHSSLANIGNKPDRPSNVKIEIENANEYPITNVVVFDKYITPLLKVGEKKTIECTYSDPTNTYTFPKFVAIINASDYERDNNGLPKWFNINYEDVDGNAMYQTFELKHFDETEYYSLEGRHEV